MAHARHVFPRRDVRRGPTRTRQPGRRRPLGRIVALLLTLALVLQGILGGTGTRAVAAQTETGDSIYLTVGERIWYGGLGTMGTARMSANGEVAYCADPKNNPPKSGYYTREPVQTVENAGWRWPVESVERVMYYGFGGPGFDPDYWRSHIGGTDAQGRSFPAGQDWDGSSITDDEFYVYTHILVADRVTSDGGSRSRTRRTPSGRGTAGTSSATPTAATAAWRTRAPWASQSTAWACPTGSRSIRWTPATTPRGWRAPAPRRW